MIIDEGDAGSFKVRKNALDADGVSVLDDGAPMFQREVNQVTDISSKAQEVVC